MRTALRLGEHLKFLITRISAGICFEIYRGPIDILEYGRRLIIVGGGLLGAREPQIVWVLRLR